MARKRARHPTRFISAIHFCRLSWALAIGAPAMKEARTTRVAGPHAEFQTSGEAQESCAAKSAAFTGSMELLSARLSVPLSAHHCEVRWIGYGFAAGAPPNGSGFSDRR